MSVITRTDVTAVKFYDKYILAGIGSYVNVFNCDSAAFIHKIHALRGQKIYNFVVSRHVDKVLVFGGKQFTVLTKCVSNDEVFVKNFEAIICNDWIHCGIWLADTCIALLTAHNVVQKWDPTNQSLMAENISKDNSILYSGLLLPLENKEVLVFCGTVFSEVLIHRSGSDEVLHSLKGHKGVIFSVTCNPQKGVIVTTSDDRSVRIWQLTNTSLLPNSIEYWQTVNITCIHELYGHLARVMRNCLTDDFVVSIGEDSLICFWGYDGKLYRKVPAHTNACIWSLDADDKHLVTGGGDSGVIVLPLSVVTEYGTDEVLDIDVANAKKIVFTARRNIAIMTENNELVYFNRADETTTTFELKHQSTYKLLSISSCKQIIAVVDMVGKLDVYIENCKGDSSIRHLIDTKLEVGKILSMEWAGNRHLVLCSDIGVITVLAAKGNTTEILANFLLPPCKERWLTSAAIDLSKDMLVVSDRCGSLHIYTIGQKNPTKSFKNVHGRYGATSINVENNSIVTTGRDATVKYFRINSCRVKLMSSQSFDFQWVEAFIDKDKRYICAFQERVFVVYDMNNNTKLFEVNCGGGRRSWDVVRYIEKVDSTCEEFIKFIYLKNSQINTETFQLSKVAPRMIVHGTHAKEINCLKIYKRELDPSTTFMISGGEDTSIRISSLNSHNDFKDEVIFKQLSNVRTLKYTELDSKVLVVSAGGRAQICIKLLEFHKVDDQIRVETEELCDYMVNGTDKERKGNQTWRNCTIDFDPETRIMDVGIIKRDISNFLIITGCSDAYLRIFNFEYDGNKAVLKLLNELKHHETCILKTHSFEFNNKTILITATTRGIVTFWKVENLNNDKNPELKPFASFPVHNSGINALECKVISDTEILIATGGDDNTIRLNLIQVEDLKANIKLQWSSNNLHCSQVTGVKFVDDRIVTTSIDQRITLLRWRIEDDIKCEFVTQVYSDVADIQGLDVITHDSNSISVCVFGKGIEVVSMSGPPQ